MYQDQEIDCRSHWIFERQRNERTALKEGKIKEQLDSFVRNHWNQMSNVHCIIDSYDFC